ncbi:MAG: HdeD family acid-resistance protein [Phycisphaerae bacterium]|nr:HdeD family acid-resistance protein [Phycisphaerae bacterium]
MASVPTTTQSSNSNVRTGPSSPGLALIYGILMLVVGVIGVGAACVLTWTTAIFFGCLLVFGGIAAIARAVTHDTGGTRIGHVLLGLAYIVGGMIAILHPYVASIALTLWIAIALVVAGIFQMVVALRATGMPNRAWAGFSGLASFVLGAMIWYQWPASGIWAIGMFMAIELMVQGWAWIMGAMAMKAESAAMRTA